MESIIYEKWEILFNFRKGNLLNVILGVDIWFCKESHPTLVSVGTTLNVWDMHI